MTRAGDPADYDRLRRRVLWSLPTGLYVLGACAGARRNLMTCNLAIQVATEPKLVGVAVERGALTHELIEAGGAFSLCLLRRADRATVRRFVKPAEDDPVAGTLSGLPVQTARSGAPILGSALAWLDCEVRQTLDCGSHGFFVGEVIDCGPAGFGADGQPDEVLRMEDTRMSYGG